MEIEYRITWEYDDDADWSFLDQDEWAGQSADDYVALWARCEYKASCGHWEHGDSLGGVMFDADGDWETGTFGPDHQYTEGYQAEVARELAPVSIGA